MRIKKHHFTILFTTIISASLLLLSLTKNAYYIGEMKDSLGSFGLIAFFLGWLNLFGAGICWLANPFLILSWASSIASSEKRALIFGGIAMFFSLLFLCMNYIIANEGGMHEEITAYGAGYWLWLSSCGVNFLGTIILYYQKTVANSGFAKPLAHSDLS